MKFKLLPSLILMSKLFFGSLFVQTVLFSTLFASDGNSQEMLNANKVFISLELKDASLLEVFQQIESSTDFTFSYEKKDLDENVRINLGPGNRSVAEILRTVSRVGKLKFKQINNSINISKMPLNNRQSYEIEVIPAAIQVAGRVTSEESDEGIPGVNVLVKGTSQGVVTDLNGDYTISVPSEESTLVFSFVGFLEKEVVVGSQTTINVVLESDVKALEEVVVVGYGTQQRAEITGAVSSINAETIKEIPVVSFENAIQGRVAGVDVAVPSGEPGAAPLIRIRGTGSISAGNDPLYVIDGLPISRNSNLQADVGTRRGAFSVPKANAFASLNPNDIESIEILKDASAAAIYGSRASNGVVLITTRKGTKGGPQLSFNAFSGVQHVMNRPDLMNAEELIDYTKDSRNNNYLQSYDPLNPDSPNYNPVYDPNTNAGRPNVDFILIPEKYVNWDGTDTDWLDEIFSTGSIQSYNLSVSGGSDNFTYYTSGGYYNEKGVVEGSEFDRFTFSTSMTNKLTENIKVGGNLNVAFTNNNRLPVNAPYFASPPGIVYAAMVHSPVIKPYEEDGVTPNQRDNQSFLLGGTTTADNPLAIIEAVNENIKNYRTFGNVFASYDFLENFTFKTYAGIDIDNYRQSFYRGNSLLYRGAPEGDPYGQSSAALGVNWIWENTVSYSNKFDGGHSLNAVVGYTAQRQSDELSLVYARNFPDDQVQTVSGGIVTGGTSLQEEWSLVSMLARVNYSLNEKYLFTGTIRSDRSSRFGADNQTGIFPSASLGWRLTSEPFMANIEALNELKLRASYGVTGNFEIPNYGAIGLLGTSNYILNNQIVNGVVPRTLSNRDLSWEATNMFDVGLDFAFLRNRIYGSMDYYVSRTSDLLLFVTIPSSSGFQTALTNIGEVENRGFEVSFTSRNLVNDFTWETDFNFSTNRNKVLALGPDSDEMPTAGAAGTRHITRVGDPIGSYYGYVVEGIYQSEEEIETAPEDLLAPDPAPGDLRFKDVDGDGDVDSDDRTVLGSYYPDFTYGITNRFGYGRFDLSVFIQGVEGREVLNLTQRHLLNGEANFNSYADYNNRWISPDNPGDGIIPRADRNSGAHGNNFRPSSFQVEDGSYVRLRNLTLGYTFPSLGKTGSRFRVYATGTNLYMWTQYRGFNPEVNLQPNSSITPGEDYGAYPLSTTYMLGVNITF
jgi:TonB-linked SusC/RagA family outer membrane protein